jgi:ATP-binding cassette subfamily C protein
MADRTQGDDGPFRGDRGDGLTSRTSETPAALQAVMADLTRGVCAAGIIGLFVNILHLAVPLYSIQIYDRVITSGSHATLVALSGLVATVLVFQGVLDSLRGRIFAILSARMTGRLGALVHDAAVETTLRHGPGAAAGAMRDLIALRNFIASGTIGLPMDLAVAPVLLLVLFLMHPLYGMVGLGAVVLLSGMAVMTERLARRPSRNSARAEARLLAETGSAIRNAEAITAMGMQPDLTRRWQVSQSRALGSAHVQLAQARAMAAVSRALRMGTQVAVLAAGAVLVMDRLASLGTIVAAAVILSRLLHPFEQLIDGWRHWVDAKAAHDRLREVLLQGATARAANPVTIGSGRLAVSRMSFVPPGQSRPVLRDLTFALEPGTMLGIIGASGAGKSSLARLLVGLYPPTAGGIFLDGMAVHAHERGSFGRAVGYLPQDPMLFDGTVRDNIARFRVAPMEDVVAAARLAGVHDLIGRLPQGYETWLADGGGILSGGQRQRIALARAVFGSPCFVVMDEPNAHLDAEGEAALVAAIDILRTRGTTLVVVAQRMSILARADRLLTLQDGAMVQFGDRAEVRATLGLPRGAVPAAEVRRA